MAAGQDARVVAVQRELEAGLKAAGLAGVRVGAMGASSGCMVGDRVELHPASSWWARGARYGQVTHVGRGGFRVRVRLDARVREVTMPEALVLEVVS